MIYDKDDPWVMTDTGWVCHGTPDTGISAIQLRELLTELERVCLASKLKSAGRPVVLTKEVGDLIHKYRNHDEGWWAHD